VVFLLKTGLTANDFGYLLEEQSAINKKTIRFDYFFIRKTKNKLKIKNYPQISLFHVRDMFHTDFS
jgi:hypothetical protein